MTRTKYGMKLDILFSCICCFLSINVLSSWYRLVSSAQSTCSRWGSSQDFVKAITKPQLQPDWSVPLPLLMCVWDRCSVGPPNCTQDPIFWLMSLAFPEEFGDNHPSSLFHLLSSEQHSIILPASSPHLKFVAFVEPIHVKICFNCDVLTFSTVYLNHDKKGHTARRRTVQG